MAYEEGLKGEEAFKEQMTLNEIQYDYDDSWYDFRVYDEKVEVKSCRISQRDNLKNRAGRFDFNNEDNREKQFKENIWVCFIVRHYEQYILLGFIRAKELKQKRSINLINLRDYSLLSLEAWIELHKQGVDQ